MDVRFPTSKRFSSAKCRWSFPTPETSPAFTIGHSTRSIPEFAAILQSAGVELVVDVRTVPRSRTNPQYNFDVLPEQLLEFGIGYLRIAELGGLRGRSRTIAPEVNAFWKNQSFHNYADYALSREFDDGLEELTTCAAKRPAAIMCAEAVWWRCHRRIITDYLLMNGWKVLHLMGQGREDRATVTPAAKPQGQKLVYPAPEPAAG